LAARGVSVGHLHASTLKPFDSDTFLAAAKRAKAIVTLENHTIVGGLGSLIAEILADQGLGRKLRRLGLNDTFAHGASRPYLMKKYGLDAGALVAAIGELLRRDLAISDADLNAVRLDTVHSGAKAEAL
jgi:transketolase